LRKFRLKLDVIFSEKESQRETEKCIKRWVWIVKGGIAGFLLIHRFFL